jgi:hypothetical protein
MTRLRIGHEDDSPAKGLGLAGLAVGLLAGLAAGAYLAHRLGGASGISHGLRRRLRKAGEAALAGQSGLPDDDDIDLDAEVLEHDDAEDADELSAAEESLDEEAGDDWEDDDEDEGDQYDDEGEGEEDEEFSSADPELEDRVLEAFTNDPLLSERAVDIGAIRPATIELIGTVHSEEEYDYAATLTGGVPGVEKVVNRLMVREPESGSAKADKPPSDDQSKSRDARRSGGTETEGPADSQPTHN